MDPKCFMVTRGFNQNRPDGGHTRVRWYCFLVWWLKPPCCVTILSGNDLPGRQNRFYQFRADQWQKKLFIAPSSCWLFCSSFGLVEMFWFSIQCPCQPHHWRTRACWNHWIFLHNKNLGDANENSVKLWLHSTEASGTKDSCVRLLFNTVSSSLIMKSMNEFVKGMQQSEADKVVRHAPLRPGNELNIDETMDVHTATISFPSEISGHERQYMRRCLELTLTTFT